MPQENPILAWYLAHISAGRSVKRVELERTLIPYVTPKAVTFSFRAGRRVRHEIPAEDARQFYQWWKEVVAIAHTEWTQKPAGID